MIRYQIFSCEVFSSIWKSRDNEEIGLMIKVNMMRRGEWKNKNKPDDRCRIWAPGLAMPQNHSFCKVWSWHPQSLRHSERDFLSLASKKSYTDRDFIPPSLLFLVCLFVCLFLVLGLCIWLLDILLRKAFTILRFFF